LAGDIGNLSWLEASLKEELESGPIGILVNNSGGQWSSPDKPMLAKIHDEIADRKKNIK
jgi:hypothetical protein